MEESYTVHRRRKAAASARRRDKTPEAPRRPAEEDESRDEEAEATEEARARMERMVEDTERMEAIANDQRTGTDQIKETQADDSARQSELPKADTDDATQHDAKVTEIVANENRPESVKRPREASRRRAKRSQERWSSGSSADDDKSSKSETEKVERKREKKPRRLRKEYARDDATRLNRSGHGEEPVAPPRIKSSHSEEPIVRSKSSHPEESTRPAKSQSDEPITSRSRKSSRSEEPRSRKSSRSEDTAARAAKSSHSDDNEAAQSSKSDPPTSRTTKQIIPLSNDSLIHDLEIAQQKYDRREIGILDPDVEDYVSPRMEAALRKRRRNRSRKETARDMRYDSDDGGDTADVKVSRFWSWLRFFKSEKKEKIDDTPVPEPVKEKEQDKEDDVKRRESRFLEYLKTLSDIRAEFKMYVSQNPYQMAVLRQHRNRCIAEFILIVIYLGLGAFMFRFSEGAFEQFYKCGVKRVKRDFLDSLWNYSHNMREDDWKSMARRKLMEFEEQLYEAYDAGLHTYSGQKSWSFLNAFVYCLTVITTIGYGHIAPSTPTGQAITIVYAIFGIPIFLIVLADFGKLFTRGMKFLWAFVRRLYYTGSCRRVRRTAPVQEVMKGVQLVYDFATFRRPSQMNPEEIEEMNKQRVTQQTILPVDGNAPIQPDTPGTPAMSSFEIDDEFNLPISVAITILLAYIFIGATVYNIWEDWNFFQSFYFVFISMSTIGFGDFVPKHPMYMMCSIVYLVFGLALTSMCINVVQVMLSDSFKQASQKIGATIGFEVAVDDGSIQPAAPPPVEVADVHATIKEESESTDTKLAPTAKEEDVDL